MPLNPLEVVGGIAIGEGVGGAIGAVVEPQLQTLKNAQWAKHPDVPPDVMTLAEGVAQGQVDENAARAWAHEQGFDDRAFTALVRIADTGPGTSYAFQLWRRGKIGETAFRRALKRAALEDEWIDALVEIKQDVLDPAVIATAVQRGLLPNDGILPVGPPTGRGKVPPMPMVDLDPFTEAAGSGVNADRLKVLARIVGLPASPDLAARMTFRKIIERVDFDRAISEGNTRNEWADALFEGFREILTAHNYAELELRGYLDRQERLAGTAKHGMSAADSDLLYDVLGRSIPVRQIETGQARGGVYNGPIDGIPAPYLAAMRRGNLRPEYYNLAYANRYSYPSAFVLRSMTEAGDISRDEAHTILLEIGWKPALAEKVSARWAGGAGSGGDANVRKAQVQLWGTTHRSYVAGESDETTARERLTELGIADAAQAEIVGLWDSERELIRKQLTPAQVKKAYAKAVTNPATGVGWTRDDAVAALLDRGYSINDTQTFLDE